MYPEAAWLGACTSVFPSRIQWLYKPLVNVETLSIFVVPDYSTAYSTVLGDNVTLGSGTTMQQIPINEQVSLDWLVYALRKNCWNLLYKEKKVNATQRGLDLFELRIKQVLDVAVTEGIFTQYRITSRSLNRQTSTASFTFTATLQHSILGVDTVEGVIYQ